MEREGKRTMRTNRWAVAVLFVSALLMSSGSVCGAVDLPKEFPSPDGYTVRIPDDWIAIPREVLDGSAKQVEKTFPNASRPVFAQGFQVAASKGWLTYPYVLVQTIEGRIPEAALGKMEKVREAMEKRVAKDQSDMSRLMADAKVGEPTYDASAHIIWTVVTLEVKGVGTVKTMVAALLTEKGAVRLSGSATADEYEKYLPVFEAIARGATVSPELQYKPRSQAELGPGALWVVFGLFVIFMSIRHKRAMTRPI